MNLVLMLPCSIYLYHYIKISIYRHIIWHIECDDTTKLLYVAFNISSLPHFQVLYFQVDIYRLSEI